MKVLCAICRVEHEDVCPKTRTGMSLNSPIEEWSWFPEQEMKVHVPSYKNGIEKGKLEERHLIFGEGNPQIYNKELEKWEKADEPNKKLLKVRGLLNMAMVLQMRENAKAEGKAELLNEVIEAGKRNSTFNKLSDPKKCLLVMLEAEQKGRQDLIEEMMSAHKTPSHMKVLPEKLEITSERMFSFSEEYSQMKIAHFKKKVANLFHKWYTTDGETPESFKAKLEELK